MFDFKSILNGLTEGGGTGEGGGMFGGPIMGIITQQLSSPSTQKMIDGKLIEFFKHLSERFECEISDVHLMLGIVGVPVMTDGQDGNQVIQMGEDGKQLIEQKGIVYIYVKGKAVEKIFIKDFMSMMMTEQGQNPAQ